MSAKYKFDGSKLTEKNRSTVIANVRGDRICDGTSSSRVVANVRGDRICDGTSSSKFIANVKSGNLCSKAGSSRICKMKDIHNEIEGPGEVIKAALWLCFVK
jgi:hypothetical protein